MKLYINNNNHMNMRQNHPCKNKKPSNNLIYSLRVLMLVIFSMYISSCNNDYLEKYPLDSPSDVTFYSNETELTMAVNAIYTNLYYSSGNKFPFQLVLDVVSDIEWDRNQNSELQLTSKGLHTTTMDLFYTTWDEMYKGIGECNNLIHYMNRAKGNTPENAYKRIEAEARFFRAYFYHMLVELYGDVPLIKEPLDIFNSKISKTTKSDILQFIYSELDAASEVLPISYTGDNVGRITKGAALAIKARAALYNGDWEIAKNASASIMSLNYYSLYPDYEKLFSYDAEGKNQEEILTVQYNLTYTTQELPACFDSRNAGGVTNKIPTQALVDSYECIDGLMIDKSPLYNGSKPFVNRDPRLNATVAVPGSIFLGYQFETHPDSVKCWNYNVNPPIRINNNDVTNAYATFSGYCLKKYTKEERQYVRTSALNVILLRYAEILLMYAESKIELNQIDESVYSAINKVRQRVKMPIIEAGKTQAEMRRIVRHERKVEFASEGLRYFDIKRWKIAEDVISGPLYGRPIREYRSEYVPVFDENGTPHYDAYANKLRRFDSRIFNSERDYLWPIPQKELDINSSLFQNPGY